MSDPLFSFDVTRPPGHRELSLSVREAHLAALHDRMRLSNRRRRLVVFSTAAAVAVLVLTTVGSAWRGYSSDAADVGCQFFSHGHDHIVWVDAEKKSAESALAACASFQAAHVAAGVHPVGRAARRASAIVCTDEAMRYRVILDGVDCVGRHLRNG